MCQRISTAAWHFFLTRHFYITWFTRFLHDFTWFLRNFTWFLHDFTQFLRFCCQAPKTILHPCYQATHFCLLHIIYVLIYSHILILLTHSRDICSGSRKNTKLWISWIFFLWCLTEPATAIIGMVINIMRIGKDIYRIELHWHKGLSMLCLYDTIYPSLGYTVLV